MQRLHFESPWAFLLLLCIPLLWYYRRNRMQSAALYLPTLEWLRDVARRRNWPIVLMETLRVVSLVIMVVALARPQIGTTEVERLTEGVDIVMAIDTSGSMQALDFTVGDKRVDRLTVIKQVAGDFIKGRTDDRIGLVVFGDNAFTQCPPTLDHRVLLQFLNWTYIGMAGKATAVGSAIAVAAKRLESTPAKSKVIILLTDGKSNAGNVEPAQAVEIAKALGIKVYAIGVGTNGAVPFPVQDLFGTRIVQQQLELDEASLQQIAAATGGLYFNATNTESLREIYARIDRMEKTEIKTKEYRQYEELFPRLLLPALLALLLVLIADNTVLRRVP